MSDLKLFVSCPMFDRQVSLETACRGERADGPPDPCQGYTPGLLCLNLGRPVGVAYCADDCPNQRGDSEALLCGAKNVVQHSATGRETREAGLPGVPLLTPVGDVRAQSAPRHLCAYPRVLKPTVVDVGNPFESATAENGMEV